MKKTTKPKFKLNTTTIYAYDSVNKSIHNNNGETTTITMTVTTFMPNKH